MLAAKRRVILKSGSHKGGALGSEEWASIVAMWKPPCHPLDPHATVCKSIEAPAAGALSSATRVLVSSVHNVAHADASGGKSPPRKCSPPPPTPQARSCRLDPTVLAASPLHGPRRPGRCATPDRTATTTFTPTTTTTTTTTTP